MQPKSYLRNGWNILDCVVVLTSFGSSYGDSGLGKIRVLRTLRCLRPLRLLQRNNGMRIAVLSLIKCIPSVLNIALVCFLFFSIFGILGVQLFKGSFVACTTGDGTETMTTFHDDPTRPVTDLFSCVAAGGAWAPATVGFDSFP
eukprot:CAMPEP_0114568778 /NCGR_PEP_ID=MMETSP0114-20121206/16249_1 /TAXON_ID=31324 /ORGANISM="Goniomonas sp, Strain m" /LENGTH=143 /DNA_ID=CAMNT_0001755563 /DNA_START=156 /DNA_END=583 /DNA_ORIENTATION=-